ncbi:MAG: hypothetical protein WCN88_01875 [Candidatus Falkowbacteria bacterium]
MNESTCLTTTAKVAILVPKTNSGFFTAVSLKNYLQIKLGITEILVIEVIPCQLRQVKIPNSIEELYVGGLGVKNCHQPAIISFIEEHDAKIMLWADNHPEGKHLEALKAKNQAYLHASDKKNPSCAALLNKKLGESIKPEWVEAANHFENPLQYPSAHLANAYKKLTTSANGQLAQIKELFSQHLLQGSPSLEEIAEIK